MKKTEEHSIAIASQMGPITKQLTRISMCGCARTCSMVTLVIRCYRLQTNAHCSMCKILRRFRSVCVYHFSWWWSIWMYIVHCTCSRYSIGANSNTHTHTFPFFWSNFRIFNKMMATSILNNTNYEMCKWDRKRKLAGRAWEREISPSLSNRYWITLEKYYRQRHDSMIVNRHKRQL